MKHILFLAVVVLLASLFSCTGNQDAPRIDYSAGNTDSLTIESVISDTTKAIIATLPLYFDSTNVLIQPSGLISIKDIYKADIYDRIYESKMSSREREPEFYANNINGDILSGIMSNIYFDDLNTNTKHLLTNQLISIQRVVYLREIAKNTDRHYLLYSLYDKDTNRNRKLDQNDILSLYISELNGTNFRKITSENHQLLNTKLISFANRYYYTTIEDINKDGHFDKEDKYHYYYIDFSSEPYQVVPYNPTIH